LGNGEKTLSPTLSLRETKQSKGEGNAIRRVLVGFIGGILGIAVSWRFECKYRTAINEVLYTIIQEGILEFFFRTLIKLIRDAITRIKNPLPDPVFTRNEAIKRRGRRDTKGFGGVYWWNFGDCCELEVRV
jgi:P2-related tail formation protein